MARKKIAVAGATGRVGRHVVDVLEEPGHDVVPMSRSTGVDVITGEGLDEALAGVEVIIDAATGPSPDQEAATEFFATAAAQPAGGRPARRRAADGRRLDHRHRPVQRRLQRGEARPRAGACSTGPIPVADPARGAVPRVRRAARRLGHARATSRYVPQMRTQLVAARAVAEALVADLATGRRPAAPRRSPRSPARARRASWRSRRLGSSPGAASRSRIEASSDPPTRTRRCTRTAACSPARTPHSPARRSRSG